MAFSFNSTTAQKPAPFAFGSSSTGGFGTTTTNPSTGKCANKENEMIKLLETSVIFRVFVWLCSPSRVNVGVQFWTNFNSCSPTKFWISTSVDVIDCFLIIRIFLIVLVIGCLQCHFYFWFWSSSDHLSTSGVQFWRDHYQSAACFRSSSL